MCKYLSERKKYSDQMLGRKIKAHILDTKFRFSGIIKGKTFVFCALIREPLDITELEMSAFTD
jgi:hypothetical protein